MEAMRLQSGVTGGATCECGDPGHTHIYDAGGKPICMECLQCSGWSPGCDASPRLGLLDTVRIKGQEAVHKILRLNRSLDDGVVTYGLTRDRDDPHYTADELERIHIRGSVSA